MAALQGNPFIDGGAAALHGFADAIEEMDQTKTTPAEIVAAARATANIMRAVAS
jgi:hypothetical protein